MANGKEFRPFDPLGIFGALKSDIDRITKSVGATQVPLLPRWTATHRWPYHATVYGFDYPGQVLDTDDFDYLPDIGILKTWARDINIKEFGPIDGLRKSTIDKIVITGPEGFKKTIGRWELL